jgi:hypothetical protein
MRLTETNQPTVTQTSTITVFAAAPRIVLNEYNAVGSADSHISEDGDLRLGRIEGNGGDWFELVVVGTGFGTTVDMRGWQIDVSQVTLGVRQTDTITLSQDSFWAAVPAGMILTFTEDNTAEGGYDTALNAENRLSTARYAWSNIWLGDTALIASVSGASVAGIGTTTSGIVVNADDTQIAVRNSTGIYEFGPVGEGTWRYPEVNSTACFYLAADPGSGIYPGQVQADDPRKSALYFGKEPAVVSTFGLPNVGETGIQPFFGVNFPFISVRPWRFAREGEITSASADYRMGTVGVDSFQVRVKGGGTLPSWVTVPFTSGFSSDIDLAPAVGDAGIYELEVVVTAGSLQTVEPYTVVVLPATSEVLVNEYNAVSSSNRLNAGVIPVPADGDGVDTFFGTVDGNGGDWLEVVVVGDGSTGTTDLRGWRIEIDEAAGTKFTADEVIVLSQDPYWAAVPNGTILTITEKTSAEGGLDTWIHKVNRLGQAGGSGLNDGGYAWSNIHYLDPVYIDQTASVFGDGLGISSNNTQIRILKPRVGVAGQFDVVAGPVGEGVQPLSGVNNTEVLELETDPTPTVSPYLSSGVITDTTAFIYDDGNGSTFGSPNRFTAGTQAQNFAAYRVSNSAPTFANSPARSVESGSAYAFTAATADAEGEEVEVTVVQKPAWLAFSGGVLSGTAGAGGVYLVELLATDSVGGTTTLKYQLTVTEPLSNDTTPPVITLAGDNPLTVLWGLTWIDDFSAFDAGDNTNVTVTRVNQVDTKKPGTYTNLYTAADSKGNAATNTRVVHVRFANGGSERGADGLPDAVRYALGADGTNPLAQSLRPAGNVSGSQLVLSYQVRPDAGPVELVPVVSTSLANSNSWTTSGVTVTPVGTTNVNGEVLERRQATVPVDGTRKFLRLRATSQ